MDIAITLTRALWNKIVAGEKTIELRKNFPQKFQLEIDRVYVCIKGTNNIVGFFSVSSFELFYTKNITDFESVIHKIAVQGKWLFNYVGNSSSVYLWHIKNVVAFSGNGFNRAVYNLDRNPQSFVYL